MKKLAGFIAILAASAAAIVLLSSSLARAAAPPPATGSVEGSVRASGTAVSGARVAINSSGSSSYSGSATTDQSGSFAVSEVPVGSIDVKVYDKSGNLLVAGHGTLKGQGSTLSLTLNATVAATRAPATRASLALRTNPRDPHA
jgi:hypothetical protein